MTTAIEEAYREWLIGEYGIYEGKTYFRLLRTLYKKEFYSLVKWDENRATDGARIRKSWADENSLDDEAIDFGICKSLEALIAMTFRVMNELYGSQYALSTQDIFWIFLSNLGLDKYDDTVITQTRNQEIDDILNIWLERKYNDHCVGGLFPVKNVNKDMRTLELWVQMGIYIRENWRI